MANVSGINWGVGLRRAVVFPLNSDGSLKAVDENVYEGLEFEGPRAFEVTFPESRRIVNPGNDRVRDVIFLPPTEAITAVLRVGFDHHEINAALMNTEQFFVGESSMVGYGTDKQGYEPDVALLLMQIAHDETKLTRYRYFMIPRAKAVPSPGQFGENATEIAYNIAISPSTMQIWGVEFTEEDNGMTEAALIDGMSEGRINIVAWVGDGTTTDFDFPTDKPAISAGKICVFDFAAGTEITSGVTKEVDDLTFAVAPTANKLIVAKYEY